MIRDIREEYFQWLCNLVEDRETIPRRTYYKLFRHLHERVFEPSGTRHIYQMDENRAEDGKELRYVFAKETGCSDSVIDATFRDDPCSMLELMVGVAYRCEHQIMENEVYGDRTWFWFRYMLRSLRLNRETDDFYNFGYTESVLMHFINRKYTKEGMGGLFYIPGFRKDMRKMDIWYQMHAYLETINE